MELVPSGLGKVVGAKGSLLDYCEYPESGMSWETSRCACPSNPNTSTDTSKPTAVVGDP